MYEVVGFDHMTRKSDFDDLLEVDGALLGLRCTVTLALLVGVEAGIRLGLQLGWLEL